MSNIFTVDNCSGSLVDTTIYDLFIKKHILTQTQVNMAFMTYLKNKKRKKDLEFLKKKMQLKKFGQEKIRNLIFL